MDRWFTRDGRRRFSLYRRLTASDHADPRHRCPLSPSRERVGVRGTGSDRNPSLRRARLPVLTSVLRRPPEAVNATHGLAARRAFTLIEYASWLTAINNVVPSGPPKSRLAFRSGVRTTPSSSPAGLNT